MKIAEQEPGDVVEDVVQAGDQQQPVEKTVDEQADRTRADDPAAERVHPGFEPRKAIAEQRRPDHSGETGDDRHETPPTEESEVVGQLDVGETVVEQSGGDAGEDSRRDTELGDLLGSPRGLLDIAGRENVRRQALRGRAPAQSEQCPPLI